MAFGHCCILSAVHPRVRGEQIDKVSTGQRATGSSPRARGAEEKFNAVTLHHRFIPACAGSRETGVSSSIELSVHPRVRGEQSPDGRLTKRIRGSSPRARGAD